MSQQRRRRGFRVSAIGFDLHAGRAVVVILEGSRREPKIVLRHEIDLADPWVRESRHPYHQELGDRDPAGSHARRRGCAAARQSARKAIRTLVRQTRAHGLDPRGAAIVVASLAEPERVAGAHARAHAEESRLYRNEVERTLEAGGLRVATFLAARVRAAAVSGLGQGARRIDSRLRMFVRDVGTPWRAPEKRAALAAWLWLPR